MFSFLKKWEIMSLVGKSREELREIFGGELDDYNEHFCRALRERKKVLKKKQKILRKIDKSLCLEEYNLICQQLRRYNRARFIDWVKVNLVTQLVYFLAAIVLIWLSVIADSEEAAICLVLIVLFNIANVLALKGKFREMSKKNANLNFLMGVVISLAAIFFILY